MACVLDVPHISALGIGVSHRGIQSLGFVLTCGMAMTLVACLTVMPAWLELRRRKRLRRIEAQKAELRTGEHGTGN